MSPLRLYPLSAPGLLPAIACRRSAAKRSGFTLLEVILALAILAGAMAVLGEVNRLALRNAAAARDLARAQLLAESKLAEIQAGITSTASVDNMPFDAATENLDSSEPGWKYSISSKATDEDGGDLRPRDGHPRSAGRPASHYILARALAAGPQLHLHAAHPGLRQHFRVGRIVRCGELRATHSWK